MAHDQNRIADLKRHLADIGVEALPVAPERHRQQAGVAVELHLGERLANGIGTGRDHDLNRFNRQLARYRVFVATLDQFDAPSQQLLQPLFAPDDQAAHRRGKSFESIWEW